MATWMSLLGGGQDVPLAKRKIFVIFSSLKSEASPSQIKFKLLTVIYGCASTFASLNSTWCRYRGRIGRTPCST
ncbi:hypothetical protein ACG9X3_19820 [Acinetobacter sp. ULE_I092]